MDRPPLSASVAVARLSRKVRVAAVSVTTTGVMSDPGTVEPKHMTISRESRVLVRNDSGMGSLVRAGGLW